MTQPKAMEGSWWMSPLNTNLTSGLEQALTNIIICSNPYIDHSSHIITSESIPPSACAWEHPLWTVEAFLWVCSANLLAALPVGANRE